VAPVVARFLEDGASVAPTKEPEVFEPQVRRAE
jgi:hypothetical protein